MEITPFFSFLAEEPATVSNTSITLSITDPWFVGLNDTEKAAIASQVTKLLANEGVAFDAASYRDAPRALGSGLGQRLKPAILQRYCHG